MLENIFFQIHYFDNFYCIDRMISICSNWLQSKSVYIRMVNSKRLTSNRSLTFAVNVDLKVSGQRFVVDGMICACLQVAGTWRVQQQRKWRQWVWRGLCRWYKWFQYGYANKGWKTKTAHQKNERFSAVTTKGTVIAYFPETFIGFVDKESLYLISAFVNPNNVSPHS